MKCMPEELIFSKKSDGMAISKEKYRYLRIITDFAYPFYIIRIIISHIVSSKCPKREIQHSFEQ